MAEPDSHAQPPAAPSVIASVRDAVRLLPVQHRGRLWLLVGANMATSLLDLIGVALVGVLSWQLVALVQGEGTASMPAALSWLPDGVVTGAAPLTVTALIAAGFFVVKSVLGALLSRRTLLFLARRQVAVSERLATLLFRQPISEIERRTSQETAFSLVGGVNAAIVGLLGATALGLSEVALLVVLTTALLLLNPVVTIAAIVFFGVIGLLVHRRIGTWAAVTGRDLASSTYALIQQIQEGLNSFREITVAGRIDNFTSSMSPTLTRGAAASSTITYIGQLPKYVYETALILGAIALGAVEFSLLPAGEAVATVTVFLAAGSRIMPSMLRLQNCLASIRSSAGQASPTFNLFQRLEESERTTPHVVPTESITEFAADVRLASVDARYPETASPALVDISLVIPAGAAIAVVGPTGAGKSTLADVILGILPAESGTVTVGGVPPTEAILRWPGQLAYVPQQVGLMDASVRQNIAIALPDDQIDDDRCWEVLDAVRLGEFLRTERDGLSTWIGEHGTRLSGGQRQRIGLARALYANPRILVLDEATSALDAETEAGISAAIRSLRGSVTTIIIAHRLATVRDVDVVLYVDQGRLVAQGSFDHVRETVPQFDESARLLGL